MPHPVPLVTAFAALAFIAAIWIAGSLLHWRNLHMLLMTAGVVGLAGLIGLGWWLWRRRRTGNKGEPASPEGLRLLRQQWRMAMGALREAGIHGQVVSRLPWFLVIGSPNSGKTSLLANAGLGFSTVGGTASAAEPKPTATFTLWRSEDAVFIDVAGRYLSDPHARREWLALLRLIRKERHCLPLHGVIITKPLAEQFRGGLSAAAVEANLVRDRLQEVAEVCGAAVPSYVVITKADLLGGFKEFFAGADRGERESVLGLTMPWPATTDPVHGFAGEFGRLVDSLCDRRLTALTSVSGEVAQRKLLQFPAQMRAVLPYITDYLAIAVRPVPGNQPGFRGVYFASSLAAVPTAPRAAAAAAPAVPAKPAQPEGTLFLTASPAAATPTAAQPGGAASSSFVRDLLARVVLPDACLARPTLRAQRRWHVIRALCLGVAPVVAGLLLLWTVGSAWRSVRLIESLRQPCQAVAEAERHEGKDAKDAKDAKGDPTDRLIALDRLGTALVALVKQDSGSLRPAAESAAALYGRSLRTLLLDTCITTVRADLEAMRTGPAVKEEELCNLFRTYQMLGGTLATQPEVVVGALLAGRRWFRAVDPASGPAEYRIEALARLQLDICAQTLMPAGLLRVDIDRPLVAALNRELGERLWIQQGYDEMIRQVSPQFGVVQPETLLAGPSRAALTTGTSVSLVYSQAAWDTAVVHAINEKADALVRTFAELNLPSDRAAIVRRLSERFVEDHNRHWLGFIAGVRAAQVSRFRDTPEQIERICGADSPYPKFIAQVTERLSLKTIGVAVPWGDDSSWVKPSLQSIAELRKDALDYLQVTQDGKRSADVEKLKVLVDRFNAVSARIGEQLINIQPTEKRTAIHQGLDSILHSLFASLDQEVARELDSQWTDKVHQLYATRLSTRFPFARDAVEDVTMREFEAFFNPANGTLWSMLSQIETMRGIRVLNRPSVTLSEDYERMLRSAKDIRTLFFAGSSESLKLQFAYRMQQREGVRDMQVQFGAKTSSLYDRPDFRYTAEIKRGDAYGAKVAIQTVTGQWKSSENNRGDWGFLRLLRAGSPKVASAGGYQCTWEHDGSAAGKTLTFKASLVLESGGIEKVVTGDLLSGLDLPKRILRLDSPR